MHLLDVLNWYLEWVSLNYNKMIPFSQPMSYPKAKCPMCEGAGVWISAHGSIKVACPLCHKHVHNLPIFGSCLGCAVPSKGVLTIMLYIGGGVIIPVIFMDIWCPTCIGTHIEDLAQNMFTKHVRPQLTNVDLIEWAWQTVYYEEDGSIPVLYYGVLSSVS